MLQHYHHGMEDEVWKSEPFGSKTHRTSNCIQSVDEVTLGIGFNHKHRL